MNNIFPDGVRGKHSTKQSKCHFCDILSQSDDVVPNILLLHSKLGATKRQYLRTRWSQLFGTLTHRAPVQCWERSANELFQRVKVQALRRGAGFFVWDENVPRKYYDQDCRPVSNCAFKFQSSPVKTAGSFSEEKVSVKDTKQTLAKPTRSVCVLEHVRHRYRVTTRRGAVARLILSRVSPFLKRC